MNLNIFSIIDSSLDVIQPGNKMSASNERPCENGESHDIQTEVSTSEWDNMDVHELLNFVDTHPEQKSDIVRVYRRRFDRLIVGIQTARDDMANDTSLSQSDTDDEIYIRGQRMWFHYLNVFGSVITRLKIYYSEFNETQCRELHQIISQNCAVNLIEITFIGIKRDDPIDDLANYQFPNVERVGILDSELSDRLPLFSKFFPNVHILKLINVNMDSFDAYFKHLDRFVIIKDDGVQNGVKNKINVICRD